MHGTGTLGKHPDTQLLILPGKQTAPLLRAAVQLFRGITSLLSEMAGFPASQKVLRGKIQQLSPGVKRRRKQRQVGDQNDSYDPG